MKGLDSLVELLYEVANQQAHFQDKPIELVLDFAAQIAVDHSNIDIVDRAKQETHAGSREALIGSMIKHCKIRYSI